MLTYIDTFERAYDDYGIAESDDGYGIVAYTKHEEEWENDEYTFEEYLFCSSNSCFLIGVRYKTKYYSEELNKQILNVSNSIKFD